MTELQKQMMDKLRLKEENFEPSKASEQERIKELESQNQMLIECLMEMSEIIYA